MDGGYISTPTARSVFFGCNRSPPRLFLEPSPGLYTRPIAGIVSVGAGHEKGATTCRQPPSSFNSMFHEKIRGRFSDKG